MRDYGLERELEQNDQLAEFERQLSRTWPLTVLALLILCGLILLSLPTKNDDGARTSSRSSFSLR